MKQFKTLLFAAALFFGATSLSQAQTKIAHINTQELVAAMPATKSAQAEVEKLAKTYESDIKSMAEELDKLAKRYDAESASQTQEENMKRVQEVQTKEQNIRQFQGQAQQELQKKEFDLLKPITEKAKAAILKIGRAQGFTYVLDSSQGGVIMADGKDIMADVKKELGF